MRIFLSWSGNRSLRVAQALRSWIPSVLPNVSVFLSESIEKGARWNHVLSDQLEQCSFGILLVTKENQSSPYLVFEAGALSKVVTDSRVVPLLLNLSPSELKAPLAQFQAALAGKDELLKILIGIAAIDPSAHVDEVTLRHRLDVWWPHLEKYFEDASGEGIPARSIRRSLLGSSVPWLKEIVASDPQNASFAIGDAVVFDQSGFGTAYRNENIHIAYSDEEYRFPLDLRKIAVEFRATQIGRDLPHYTIVSFKHSESDYPEVLITLARCWYMDVRSIQAALQANPGRWIAESGSTLVDRLIAMSPLSLNSTPLPSLLSVNVAVILQPIGEEAQLLLVQRGPNTQVGYYPGAWSVSIQETMSAGGGLHAEDAQESDISLQACAIRGIREELLGPDSVNPAVELHSFFIEAPLLNQSVMATARIPLTFGRVCERRRYLAVDSRESGLLCTVPCTPEVLLRLLDSAELSLDYVRAVGRLDSQASSDSITGGRTWHPSSKLAIFSVLRRYFPERARAWLVSQIESQT